MKNRVALLLFSIGAAAALHAAPKLRLTQTAVGPVPVAQGSNTQLSGPQTPYAYNAGDGSLSLKLTSSDTWLVPTLGAATACQSSQACTPIRIALQTSSLAIGTYTGFITVSDPNAYDAPQTISVTVSIGGGVPGQITFYAPPDGTASSTFNTTGSAGARATTDSGGAWLSVAAYSNGSFAFSIPYTVTANAAHLAVGDYSGNIVVVGSSLGAENKSVPVALHVTTQPIAQPTSTSVQFRIAQGAAKQVSYVVLNNTGQSTLTVSAATVATASGGSWLTAATSAGNVITLTADASTLAPGPYQGTLTITSNAVNGPSTIPVLLTVVAAGPPVVSFQGVVNVFTNSPDDHLSQGDVVAIYGEQFTSGSPQTGTLPLGTTLAGTQVLINGNPVPVQYISAGQINIHIPYDEPTGDTTLTVVNNGQKGNTVSIHINPVAPVLLPYPGGSYVLAQTVQGGGFEGYSPAAPAHIGDTVVFYGVGFGATSPSVPAGTAAPGPPGLAVITPTPKVCFGAPNPIAPVQLCSAPLFAGLTPAFFGLYQVNFTIPQNAPKGDAVPIFLQIGQSFSNILSLAIH